MKNILFVGALLSFVFNLNAQSPLKIARLTNPTTDLQNIVITESGLSSDIEIAYYLAVINEGNTDLNMKVRRTEIDVPTGTENATCWKICPPKIQAGVEVVQISQFEEIILAGDTNKTFAAHYYPENVDGCALFKFEWIDANDPNMVYGSVMIKFLHSTGTCTVDIVEEKEIDFSMYPNPANNNVNISVENLNESAEIAIVNILGQTERTVQAQDGNVNINTSELKNGVYFVTVKENNITIKTEKLVVKH